MSEEKPYDGPERRKLPRGKTLPPEAPVEDRLLMRLDTIRRVIANQLDQPERALPRGSGA